MRLPQALCCILSTLPLLCTGAEGQDLGFRTTGNDYVAFQRVGDSLSGSVIKFNDGRFEMTPVTGTVVNHSDFDLTLTNKLTNRPAELRRKYYTKNTDSVWRTKNQPNDLFSKKFRTLYTTPIDSNNINSNSINSLKTRLQRIPTIPLIEYGNWLRLIQDICAAKSALGLIIADNDKDPSNCSTGFAESVQLVVDQPQVPIYEIVARALGEGAPRLEQFDREQFAVTTTPTVLASIGSATDWTFSNTAFDASSAQVITSSARVIPRPTQRLPQFRFMVQPETIFHRMQDRSTTVGALAKAVSAEFQDVSSTDHNCMFSRGLDHPPTIVCLNHSSEFNATHAFWILSFFRLEIESDQSSAGALNVFATTLFETKYNAVDDAPNYSAFRPLNFRQTEESEVVDPIINKFVEVILARYENASLFGKSFR